MNRGALAVFCGVLVGASLYRRFPFPDDPLVRLVEYHASGLWFWLRWSWAVMMFSTPVMLFSFALSFAHVFSRPSKRAAGKLPPFPLSVELQVVLGELHHPRKAERAGQPRWLAIPERGLYTGICVVGAIGSGKTTGCMRPYAQQILSHNARDRRRRAGGLVLEVKGDFCGQVREMLEDAGRGADYVELSLDSKYVYNPLNNDQDAFSLAYSVATLLTNLYGRGKEPFWQQAYTNLVKFVILLHKVIDGYCTLFQVYECVISPTKIREKIREGEQMFAAFAERWPQIVIHQSVYMRHEELAQHTWSTEGRDLRTDHSDELEEMLRQWGEFFEVEEPEALPDGFALRVEQFQAARRWFDDDWNRIDSKLRTSIVEGISVFLSLFDDNPAVKRTFCPPREAFDPVANRDGRYGVPLPPFEELIESGKVLALNLPTSSNTATARAIGCMLKLDFQRAMLQRIPHMAAADPDDVFRPVLFLCDEYQFFASSGGSDPTGDEKFFSLSRQAKCIPLVATQSISSLKSTLHGDDAWRTLLQTFRTKLFLCVSDDFTAKVASDLCGKDEQMIPHWSMSENAANARPGMMTGKMAAHKASVTVSKSYNPQMRPAFEPKVFMELQNAQAVCMAYDGVSPLAPTLLFLKPHYLPRQQSYFEQVEAGVL